jgi:hypothetical protein
MKIGQSTSKNDTIRHAAPRSGHRRHRRRISQQYGSGSSAIARGSDGDGGLRRRTVFGRTTTVYKDPFSCIVHQHAAHLHSTSNIRFPKALARTYPSYRPREELRPRLLSPQTSTFTYPPSAVTEDASRPRINTYVSPSPTGLTASQIYSQLQKEFWANRHIQLKFFVIGSPQSGKVGCGGLHASYSLISCPIERITANNMCSSLPYSNRPRLLAETALVHRIGKVIRKLLRRT